MSVSSDLAELRRLEEAAAPETAGADPYRARYDRSSLRLRNHLCPTRRRRRSRRGQLFARFSGATAPEARAIAATLLQLGYVAAATKLLGQATAQSPAAGTSRAITLISVATLCQTKRNASASLRSVTQGPARQPTLVRARTVWFASARQYKPMPTAPVTASSHGDPAVPGTQSTVDRASWPRSK